MLLLRRTRCWASLIPGLSSPKEEQNSPLAPIPKTQERERTIRHGIPTPHYHFYYDILVTEDEGEEVFRLPLDIIH